MRIDAYNQVTQLYKASKPNKVSSSKSVSSARDEVQISSAGRDFQVAKSAVAGASDVREDKVAEMKAKIASGNYKVSADDFASKLLEKYNSVF